MNLRELAASDLEHIISHEPQLLIVDEDSIQNCRGAEYFFVDIRSEAEFDKADIEGSVNIPF